MHRTRLFSTLLLILVPLACGKAESTPAGSPSEALPVEVETARITTFTPEIPLLGRIEAHELVPILTPQAGLITYPGRFANGLQTGVRVDQGEVLAMVTNESARLTLSEARLQARAAEQHLDRIEKGHEAGITTSAALSDAKVQTEVARERLASAERQTARLLIRAPRSGQLMVEKRWPSGTEVPAMSSIATVAAGGEPRVVAKITASDRRRLRTGLDVELIDPGTESMIASGVVEEIDAILDPTGTATVVIALPSGVPDLLPGEGVVARVLLEPREAITLPDRAVLHGSEGSAVFVVENGRARRNTVTLGSKAADRVEVIEGVQEGDQVVTTGAALLSDGLAVSPSNLTGEQR